MSSGGGKYRLDARLGGGGMAEVFVAATVCAEGFSRKVAIKKVLPGFSDNPQFAQMFVAEAQISSRLEHPNIVSVTDFDRDAEGRLFLVMEMVEGKDLDGLLQTGLLPFPVVVYVITETLRGLGYAHDLPVSKDLRGIIHRDVSPHNVLLSWEGAVKVSDFGIAKAKAASEATASVFIKGKPAYMSPEQANGRPLDGRSDLFAVGVMLWEMLVGTRLFVAEDTRATLAAVLFGQIQRPRSIRGDVPKDLERITMKLLERELPARYATADEAVSDLLDCQAAPKNGRDELRRILGERFPHQVPVRQSAMRSQGGSPTPVAVLAPTIAGPMSHPSVSAKMRAETGTIMPGDRPRGNGLKIAAVVGITVVTALLAFAIVSGLKKRGAQPTPVVDAAVVAILDAKIAGLPDAPPADAGLSADAPPPPPPVVDAGTKLGVEHPKKYGALKVNAFPVVKVYIDGAFRGEASGSLTIANVLVGTRKVRLFNPDPDNAHDETQAVTIVEGQTASVQRSK
ncbi:MAG: serine/threonine-protein kinase [Proteobacteria bacterium]|nr:serine/threonine-protein kinase [Pseudomonadota bacterium]